MLRNLISNLGLSIGILFFSQISHAQAWINYNTSNSGLLSGISSMAMDTNEVLWMGIYGQWEGLQSFDGVNWSSYNTANSGLVSDSITKVVCDKNNNLWVIYSDGGSGGQGLTKYDGINWTTYNIANSGLPHNAIHDIHLDDSNNLWLACNGITRFDGNNFTNYISVANPYYCCNIYRKGQEIYLGYDCGGLGLFRYNLSTGQLTNYTPSNSNLISNYIGEITEDKNGVLWMGIPFGWPSGNGGIASFNGNNFSAYNPFSNPYTWVTQWESVEVDQWNNVWIASTGEGLWVYDGLNFNQITGVPTTSGSGPIYVDPSGTIWYHDGYGLWTWPATVGKPEEEDGGSISVYPNPAGNVLNVSSELEGILEVKIYDIASRELHVKYLTETPGDYSIDISGLLEGVYLMIIVSIDHAIYFERIIKK